ncbi:MAG: hypothetical protein J6I68_14430 [Butyrivibrio sp.]|uniref:hypothetical protein n=1 Tax=Butyrivibrio sp. TaxID=28121 RepID=UPI001B49E253|nr:hypothetical protein [Butyrivibrio sp.]MBP3784438.1 hypothetical protein [Butyrivibrio sp.]
MRIRKILALTAVAVMLSGCGSENNQASRIDNGTKTVEDVLEEQTADSEETMPGLEAVAVNEAERAIESSEKTSDVDIDLTELSSTLVYSEVYNMMTSPDQYFGKTIKMRGNNSIFIDETTNLAYYSCVIQDATACCANGIEYELTGVGSLDGYPEDGKEITVTGTFSSYEENGAYYLVLSDASLE